MPPAMAPTVVATSRNIPRRMLVMPRAAKVVCAMDDVAITQTMLVAMAVLIGTPKARLSTGTMMTPPPTPSMLPKTPAKNAMTRMPMSAAMGGTLHGAAGPRSGLLVARGRAAQALGGRPPRLLGEAPLLGGP